ncbi:hypothetical protein KKE60_08770 [Patescibacteria group bacterium]|nr:hypothetical protein [Patescibacteria group bacterium]
MPIISLNVTPAQGLLLLALDTESHPEPDDPPLTELQRGKRVIIEVMKGEIIRLKMRQAMAAVTDDDTEMS